MATGWGLRAVSQKAERWHFNLYFGLLLAYTYPRNSEREMQNIPGMA